MNVLVTICARAGSKGVKNKNIRMFNGKPLVYYTLGAFQAFAETFNGKLDLALNTDSADLVKQVDAYGMEFTHIPRKEALAGDKVGKLPVIRDTLIVMEKLNGYEYDYIIDLDLTSPIRKAGDIEGVLKTLINNVAADVAFSVVPSRRLPFFNMVMEKENGFYGLIIESQYLSRQEAPKCYDMNASIYAYRRDFLSNEEINKVLDGNAVIYEMKDAGVLDIDSEEDLELLEYIAKHEKWQ